MISGHRLKDRLGKDRLLSFPARLHRVITMEGWKAGRGKDGRWEEEGWKMEEEGWKMGRMVFPDQLDMTITD